MRYILWLFESHVCSTPSCFELQGISNSQMPMGSLHWWSTTPLQNTKKVAFLFMPASESEIPQIFSTIPIGSLIYLCLSIWSWSYLAVKLKMSLDEYLLLFHWPSLSEVHIPRNYSNKRSCQIHKVSTRKPVCLSLPVTILLVFVLSCELQNRNWRTEGSNCTRDYSV